MTDNYLTRGSRRSHTHFGWKVILIVFSILVLSQALGTFLSVLSFEKIYIGALTSKYEIIGKDIARRIEQSLTFGKRLERFVGMERLVEPLFNKSQDLVEVFLAGQDGTIFFSAVKAEFIAIKGIADADDAQGRILPGTHQARKKFPIQKWNDWLSKAAHTHYNDGRYYTILPVTPKYGTKGILGLVFNQSLIKAHTSAMIGRSIKLLALSVAATAVILGLLIQLIFIRPARKQLHTVVEKDIAVNRIDPHGLPIPAEVREFVLKMNDFFDLETHASQDLGQVLTEFERHMQNDKQALQEIAYLRGILRGKSR